MKMKKKLYSIHKISSHLIEIATKELAKNKRIDTTITKNTSNKCNILFLKSK